MKIKASKRELTRIFEQAAAATHRDSSTVMSHVLLTADEGTVSVDATDLVLSYADSIPCECLQSGVAVVPAKGFLERLKAIDDADVVVELKDLVCTIKGGTSKRTHRISTLDPDNFPKKPVSTLSGLFSVDSEALLFAIQSTAHAISTDTDRLALASLLMQAKANGLTCVATDGHRMAWSTVTCELADAEVETLIPSRGIQQLRKLATSGDVTFTASPTMVYAKIGSATLGCRRTDAQFPPWEQVIPKDTVTTATVSRAALLGAVKAVSVATGEKQTVELSVTKASATVSAEGAGSSEDEIAAESTGKAQVRCCSRYLADALAAMPGDSVAIEIGKPDAGRPIVVKETAVSSGRFARQIVMPVHN